MQTLGRCLRISLALVLIASVGACVSQNLDGGECPNPPALAASEYAVALSCAAEVNFDGRTYSVSGGEFHESWVGEQIAGRGETNYEGAYELRTYPSEQVIAVKSTKGVGGSYLLAITDDFSKEDFRPIQEPFVDEKRKRRR